jgi:hypothetical protein
MVSCGDTQALAVPKFGAGRPMDILAVAATRHTATNQALAPSECPLLGMEERCACRHMPGVFTRVVEYTRNDRLP